MRFARSVGFTNARLNATKRGLAVEVATRLAATTDHGVCLVGADPTDRDVERHLPQLVTAFGEPARMQVNRGPHQVDVANFADAGLCVMSISDRESVEIVFPALQERFPFIIIDAPSRAGNGIGIADVLLDWLDGLIVATGVTAGELAETRRYIEHLETLPSTQRVDARVVTVGELAGGGLAPGQLESRLTLLPVLGHVPRAGGPTADDPMHRADLTRALEPMLHWVVSGRVEPTPSRFSSGAGTPTDPLRRHVANKLYQDTVER